MDARVNAAPVLRMRRQRDLDAALFWQPLGRADEQVALIQQARPEGGDERREGGFGAPGEHEAARIGVDSVHEPRFAR